MRDFPALARLLAVLLLMQWGIAFAPGLNAPVQAAPSVEIRAASPLRAACQGPAASAIAPVWLAQTADPPPPSPPLPVPPRSCQPRTPPTS